MTFKNALQFRQDLVLPAIMAISLSLLGFYIDEGKYNFDGISRPDNLLFLTVYVAIYFVFQFLVKLALEQFLGTGKSQRLIAGALAALSLPLAIGLFLWIVSTP